MREYQFILLSLLFIALFMGTRRPTYETSLRLVAKGTGNQSITEGGPKITNSLDAPDCSSLPTGGSDPHREAQIRALRNSRRASSGSP
jgi:hypothetical protein